MENTNSFVLLLVFINHKYQLDYSVMTVFFFSGHKGRCCLIEWMNNRKECRGLLLHRFSHRYIYLGLFKLTHFLTRERDNIVS